MGSIGFNLSFSLWKERVGEMVLEDHAPDANFLTLNSLKYTSEHFTDLTNVYRTSLLMPSQAQF